MKRHCASRDCRSRDKTSGLRQAGEVDQVRSGPVSPPPAVATAGFSWARQKPARLQPGCAQLCASSPPSSDSCHEGTLMPSGAEALDQPRAAAGWMPVPGCRVLNRR